MKRWAILFVVFAMGFGLIAGGLQAFLKSSDNQAETEETVETVPVLTTREKIYAGNNPDMDVATVQQNVWLGLDQGLYENPGTVKNPEALDVLVNRHWKLPEDYEPEDLQTLTQRVEGVDFQLRKEAADAYEKLLEAADEKEVLIGAVGAYTSAEDVQAQYDEGIKEQSQQYADVVFAPAGFSEMQTGLVVDLWIDGQGESIADIVNDENYDWLVKEAAKNGFVQRYTEDHQDETQYIAMPWRFRYVGKDLAKKLTAENKSLDRYVAEKNAR